MLIERSERNLIIKSSAIDLYSDLKNILLNEDKLNYNILENYDYILSENENIFLNRLITDSKNEWQVDKDYYDEDQKRKSICELCGKKGLHKRYKINNMVNNNNLIVGSTCINKFKIKNGEELEVIRANNIKLFRRTKLDKYINMEKTINDMSNIFAKSPILIPWKYKKEYKEIKHEIVQIYDKIINRLDLEFNEEDKKDIKDIEIFLQKKILYEDQILEYISISDKNDLMLPKRDLIDYLRIEDIELFYELEKDGKITWQTGYKIKYVAWLQELIFILNGKLKKFELEIKNLTSELYYILQYKNFKLDIYCNTLNLLAECGGLIFKSNMYINEEDLIPDIEHLIHDHCEVKINEYNVNLAFNRMYIDIEQFNFDTYYLEYNDVFYYSYKDKMYYQVNLKKIMNWYKVNMIDHKTYKEFLKEDLIKLISNSTSLNKIDYKELKKSREKN